MGSYISAELRRAVAERADYLCEYCLIHEEDTVFGCQVDHIISEKHNGETSIDNLAYACTCCNRSKGFAETELCLAGNRERIPNLVSQTNQSPHRRWNRQ